MASMVRLVGLNTLSSTNVDRCRWLLDGWRANRRHISAKVERFSLRYAYDCAWRRFGAPAAGQCGLDNASRASSMDRPVFEGERQ